MDNDVFVDSSAFKAITDIKDDFYPQAARLWEKLSQQNSQLVTSNYILDETFTLLRLKCNLGTALNFKQRLVKGSPILKIVRVTIDDEARAWPWFENNWSKLSFTDCVSFAMMKRLGIKTVFCFDYHFARAGFKIYA